MPKLYYIAARPETIVSIINKGLLPDNLKKIPPYSDEEGFSLFETPEAAASHSNADKKDTFILEYEFLDGTADGNIQFTQSSQTVKVCCDTLNPNKLKKIITFNKTSADRVTRLLNSSCPVEITCSPEFYLERKLTPQIAKLEGIICTPKENIKWIKTGDLLGSKMQTLINTVNCVGVMGKGIAYSFKQQYPTMFKDYEERCKEKKVQLGKPYIYKIKDERLIVNFPTKGHWKNNSNLRDIENGLKYLAEHVKEWGIKSMAIPPLGCGNGGLDWNDVKPLILRYLDPLNIPMEIYEPFKPISPSAEISKKRQADAKATPGQAQLSTFFHNPPLIKKQKQDATLVLPSENTKLETFNKIVYMYNKSTNQITASIESADQIVGFISFEKNGDHFWLTNIGVNSKYRRQKIGTHLVSNTIKLIPDLQISLINSKEGGGKYKYRLNDDGAKLIGYCISSGIVNKRINCCIDVPSIAQLELRQS